MISHIRYLSANYPDVLNGTFGTLKIPIFKFPYPPYEQYTAEVAEP